jgi:hypothetical protein
MTPLPAPQLSACIVLPDAAITGAATTSSSVFVTETSAASRPRYAGSVLTAGAVKMVYGWLPSTMTSSAPVTVTT